MFVWAEQKFNLQEFVEDLVYPGVLPSQSLGYQGLVAVWIDNLIKEHPNRIQTLFTAWDYAGYVQLLSEEKGLFFGRSAFNIHYNIISLIQDITEDLILDAVEQVILEKLDQWYMSKEL